MARVVIRSAASNAALAAKLAADQVRAVEQARQRQAERLSASLAEAKAKYEENKKELDEALVNNAKELAANIKHVATVEAGLVVAQHVANQAATDAASAKADAQTAIDTAHTVEQTAADALAKAGAAQDSAATAEQSVQQAAEDAQAVADDLAALAGKTGRVIHSDTAPGGSDAHGNNLWLDSVTGAIHHWDGTQWQEITDPTIAEAANKADQAYNLADNAQAAATQASTLADAANTLAESATTTAENAQASALAASSEAQAAKSEAEAARAEALSASDEADAAVQAAADAISKSETAEAKALAAQKAADDAAAKATTADGRVTVATANPTANDALGKPEGAIWEVRSGTSVPRRYMLVGGTWTLVKIGKDFIGENAIGTAQIIDAAIGNAKIADLAVTNAKIGSLNVAKLVADTSRMRQATVEKIIGDAAYFKALQANKVVVAGDSTNKVDAITLADGAITTPKLRVSEDMWTKLLTVAGDATVGGNLIVNDTIDASKLRVDELFAQAIAGTMATFQEAFIGKLSAQAIDLVSLEAAKFIAVGGVNQISRNELTPDLNQSLDDIASDLGSLATNKADVSVTDGLTEKVESVEGNLANQILEVASGLESANTTFTEYTTRLNQRIVMDDTGITISQAGSDFAVRITNDRMSFLQGSSEVAYLSNSKLFITDTEILNSLVLGKFSFEPRANGNLSFKYGA